MIDSRSFKHSEKENLMQIVDAGKALGFIKEGIDSSAASYFFSSMTLFANWTTPSCFFSSMKTIR